MKKVFIKTFGCSQNQSDSDRIAGVLKAEGYEIVLDGSLADVVVINSCTVKNEAETKLYREIRTHKDKKIVVAGCVAQAEKGVVDSKLKNYSVIGTSQIKNIAMVVKETLKGNKVVFLDKEDQKLSLPVIRKNKIIEIIPINEGCLGNCAYCKVKAARGQLNSYKKEEIISLARKAVVDGVKMIWITSQDTGAYGQDIDENLPNLLKELLSIPGYFKIRLGMCNPNWALKYLHELIEILNHPKMFRFVHIPLQAGNDRVLELMNRKYNKADFVKVFREFRKKVKDVTMATDVIAGFPSETNAEFEETLDLVKKLKPDILNISRFWKRPGTPAALMKQVGSKTIKERSKEFRAVFEKITYDNNEAWIGWQGDAVIEDVGKNNTFTARNFAYKPVIVKDKGQKIGDKIKVKIRSSSNWDLRT